MSFAKAAIAEHTTASLPRPHVLYFVDVVKADGSTSRIAKRYSDVRSISLTCLAITLTTPFQFVNLQNTLGDTEAFPPKRILATTFLPSAWVDDKLIAERKAGLSMYLNVLFTREDYRESLALSRFFSDSPHSKPNKDVDLEDALPSTLSRKAALEAQVRINATTPVAAAYYPDWSADSVPPESLDYSKFDILFFGKSIIVGVLFDQAS